MEVILPKVALTMSAGTIVEWYQQVGEAVRKGDALFVFETDKSQIDVEAPADGVLAEIRVQAGEEALAGTVVAVLNVAGEEPGQAAALPARRGGAAAPAAAELAAALGVDLAGIVGSGTGGRILESDVMAVASPPKTEASADRPKRDRESAESTAPLSFSPARLAAMVTLERSAAVPTFHLGGSLDFSSRWDEIRRSGVSVTDVLAIAAARALKGHPTCNARIRDGRPEGYLVPRIGILVRPGDALIPLVFEDPSGEDASTFHARRKHAQEAAAEGRIAAANAGSPTFVISNLGTHGVDWFTAMLYPDTALTLALGALGTGGRGPAELAVVLTCDHRLADGVEVARFMESLRGALLEVPIAAEGSK